jgi:type IV pilus assembly protein PilQ
MKTNWPVVRLAGILGMSFVLCAGSSRAQSGALPGAAGQNLVRASSTPSATAAITRVEASRAGDQTIVRVVADSPLGYQAVHLNNPERLVLDFSGARFTASRNSIEGLDPVVRIRAGQYKPDVTRVVIDLSRELKYDVRTEGNSVVVTFAATPGVATPPSATAERSTKSTQKPVVQPVHAPAPRQHANLAADMTSLPLPESLTQPKASLASPKPQPPAPQQQAPAASAPTPAPSQQGQTTQRVQGTSNPKYTGEPISVNFKDLDLKDFFRLIHEISGLNVVLDPSVHGSLPALVLDEVPWDQALDIVLKNNGLDKQLDGNVLRIATQDTMKKELETKHDLEKAQAESIEPVTATRVLSYTKATVLMVTLKKWLSPHGDIVADERTNTLIIRDIPSVLPDLDNLIRQLDRKSQQVEIEARVVSASRSFARDIGTQFGFATTASGGRTLFGGSSTVATSPIIRAAGLPLPPLVGAVAAASPNSIPLNTNFPATSPTSGISFAHASPNFALDYVISAAESKGVGKLLSKPKIYTQNNEKGTVKQGNRVPIQTTINNTISVQYVDAVLRLEVTPQITADGTIFMQVLVENTSIDNGIPRVQGIPALDTQAVETSVLVNDGGTVMIGGVNVTSQRTDINQVPLFGSIPVIGNLFKRTSVNVTSSELYFFLTPRVISN